MKCKCGSSKLRAYNYYNLDYIYSLVNDQWVLNDPSLSFFHATKYPFQVQCLSCGSDWKIEGELPNQVSPAINHREITLDLDHTLFCIYYTSSSAEDYSDADHSWFIPETKIYYHLYKRPGLDKFIEALAQRFDKINIFTAATLAYAQKSIPFLNIPPDKMGTLKTVSDTVLMRGLHFEREYMKFMDNSLIVEDRPEVIQGYHNVIFKLTPFYPNNEKDQELSLMLNNLNKEVKALNPPDFFSGTLELFLKQIDINFKGLPWSKISDLLNVPALNQEELNLLPVRTSFYNPYFNFEKEEGYFSFSDVSYENYLKILEIVGPYSSHKKMTKKKYSNLLEKIVLERKKTFNNNF